MHAYLYTGGETDIRENEMRKAAEKRGNVLEFSLLKIADVRNLSSFTKLSQKTPVSIFIKDIDSATTEALNAFLKNLEEPGENIYYFLSCEREQTLLPTIVSRCRIIRMGKSATKVDPKHVNSFLKMSFGQKIKFTSDIKKKDEAKQYLRKISLSAHSLLVSNKKKAKELITIIKAAQEAIYNLNLNANVNLQMTVFAVKTTNN